jgi:hypothetical protein
MNSRKDQGGRLQRVTENSEEKEWMCQEEDPKLKIQDFENKTEATIYLSRDRTPHSVASGALLLTDYLFFAEMSCLSAKSYAIVYYKPSSD